jgi:hypothetical protein
LKSCELPGVFRSSPRSATRVTDVCSSGCEAGLQRGTLVMQPAERSLQSK